MWCSMPKSDDCRALVMAGGRSLRMRATSGPLHKALVPVAGVSLLERNVRALLEQGFRDIVVAISKDEPEIGRAAERHAGVKIFWEDVPLGTIGAAREVMESSRALLVVNVDNLTSLPLKALVRFHREQNAALTIAAHQEPFQIPFGEVEMDGDRVRRYLEKPVKPIWISSGTYVLDRLACGYIPEGCRTDAPRLVAALLDADERVAAYRHDCSWIDVNHADALVKAESLIKCRGAL
jgi:NDP-sugar pyrophosphorylase family protein